MKKEHLEYAFSGVTSAGKKWIKKHLHGKKKYVVFHPQAVLVNARDRQAVVKRMGKAGLKQSKDYVYYPAQWRWKSETESNSSKR